MGKPGLHDCTRYDRAGTCANGATGESVGSTTFEVVKRECTEVTTRMVLDALNL